MAKPPPSDVIDTQGEVLSDEPAPKVPPAERVQSVLEPLMRSSGSRAAQALRARRDPARANRDAADAALAAEREAGGAIKLGLEVLADPRRLGELISDEVRRRK